jgi:hypothetical protein
MWKKSIDQASRSCFVCTKNKDPRCHHSCCARCPYVRVPCPRSCRRWRNRIQGSNDDDLELPSPCSPFRPQDNIINIKHKVKEEDDHKLRSAGTIPRIIKLSIRQATRDYYLDSCRYSWSMEQTKKASQNITKNTRPQPNPLLSSSFEVLWY